MLQDKFWELRDGLVTLFAEESSFPLTKKFDHKVVQMQEELLDLSTSSAPAEMMRLSDLSRFISKNRQGGLSTLNYEVDYHAKWAYGFASIVMALLGIPFSVVKSRSGGMFINLGVCMGLAFMYWALYSSFISMARFGYLHPIIGAWAPNLLGLSVSMLLIVRLNK
jgi:lipopolysaccharide export system permease protein